MRFNDSYSKKGDDEEDQSPPEKKNGQLKQAIKFLHKEKKVQRTQKNKYNTLIVQSPQNDLGS